MWSLQELDAAAAEGLVSRRDLESLSIYCYTARCAYDRLWTPLTRAARGIVFDRQSGQMLARPFEKFFNLGEMPETQPEALPATPFSVEEKIDGSLAILFFHAGRWRVSTKGALDSSQAQYAQAELLPRYDLASVPRTWTVLAEMLYPENRIVLDYGGRRELVLLSAIELATGAEIDARARADLARATGMREVPVHAYADLLELPFAENQEGYVARFANGLRVKVKSPRYMQVHSLLERRSPRRILDMLEAGEYEAVRAQIPDAIAGEFDDLSASLRMALRQVHERARRAFEAVAHLRADRKAFALAARETAPPEVLAMVFGLLDGKNVDPMAYRLVRGRLKEDPPEPE